MKGYWKLKEEEFDSTPWRTHFGRGYGPVVRQYGNYTRSVRKVSSHFEYLENRSSGLDVTWQPVRGEHTVYL
jgi:hypothetical protein